MERIEAIDLDGTVYRKRTRVGHRFISVAIHDEGSPVELCGHKTLSKAESYCATIVKRFDYAVAYSLPARVIA